MENRNSEKRRAKALAALLFAGGLLVSSQPAFSESKVAVDDSTIQKIAATQITPEGRAYHLLRYFRAVQQSGNSPVLEENFHYLNEPSYFFRESNILANWADELVAQKSEVRKQSKSSKNTLVAEHALKQAIAQLNKSTKTSIKLHLFFIASLLAKQAGYTDIANGCDNYVSRTIDACEVGSSVDAELANAAVSVLNSKAYAIVPIQIAERKEIPGRKPQVKTGAPSAVAFNQAEKLKLKAVAIADRLPPEQHVRRKVHRDLSLWYKQLGKLQLAERQKKIVFELVGVDDDRILYPSSGMCGRLLWWQLASGDGERFKCGMG